MTTKRTASWEPDRERIRRWKYSQGPGWLVLFIALASVTALLRVISRTQSKAGLWWDDYLSILALVCKKHGPEARATIVSLFTRLLWIEEKIMANKTIQVFVIALNALGYAGMPWDESLLQEPS